MDNPHMTADLNESDPACTLAYIVQGSICYLVNTGDVDIAEVEYDSSFVGLEDGSVVCIEYGSWRFETLSARSCLAVHWVKQEDMVYLPLRSGWFQLDISRVVMADGVAMTTPLVLKAAEKWGGFRFAEALLEREPERVEPIENKKGSTTI